MKTATFTVVGGEAKPGAYRIKLPTTIGRGREANLTIPHPLVSRLHCKVYEKRGRLFVRDLGSLNGTFVNNKRASRELALPAGDILTVGSIRLKAEYHFSRAMDDGVDAPHDTDLEIAPDHRTQTIQETTIAELHEVLGDRQDSSNDDESPAGPVGDLKESKVGVDLPTEL